MKRVLLAAWLVAAPAAHAERHAAPPVNAQWQAECGSCHVPFPPRLLPAESWARIMAGLERHFGSDASLDPAPAREIGRFLAQNAGRRAAPPDAEPRITRSDWFLRKHRKVSQAQWASPKVKNAANCAACHAGAEAGIYED